MWLDLLCDALAAYRITRLVSADDLTAGMRDRWVEAAYARAGKAGKAKVAMRERGLDPSIEGSWADYAADGDPEPPRLATLVVCRYCVGVWIGAGVAVLSARWPRLWRPVARALALSTAAVLVAGLEKD